MKTLRSLAATLVAAFVMTAAAFAADASGTWTWTSQGRGGPQENTAKLAVKDGVVTGTIATQMGETPIGDGMVHGDEISFTVTREFNGNKMVTTYTGKLAGDTITGSTERPGRDGQSMKSEWTAKRSH